MNDEKLKEVMDRADMIIKGYAFTAIGGNVQVLNLANPRNSAVLNKEGIVVETTMSDIEMYIVSKYYEQNRCFMEVSNMNRDYLGVNLPEFLQLSIDGLVKGIEENQVLRLDLYIEDVRSSINIAEVEGMITTEQAWYLRDKYL